ncbi:MAG: hypothetical protein RBU37_17525, partial [Myxococcota bacterium]|nr:hypothetical protein [Myxococcota bacterium]
KQEEKKAEATQKDDAPAPDEAAKPDTAAPAPDAEPTPEPAPEPAPAELPLAEQPTPELAPCGDGVACADGEQCRVPPGGEEMKCVSEAALAIICAKSPECASQGKCGVRDWNCAPTSVEHCAKSALCTDSAQCGFIDAEQGPACIATAESCRAWSKCADFGMCAPHTTAGDAYTYWCLPGSESDCTESAGCKNNNRCKFELGKPCEP